MLNLRQKKIWLALYVLQQNGTQGLVVFRKSSALLGKWSMMINHPDIARHLRVTELITLASESRKESISNMLVGTAAASVAPSAQLFPVVNQSAGLGLSLFRICR